MTVDAPIVAAMSFVGTGMSQFSIVAERERSSLRLYFIWDSAPSRCVPSQLISLDADEPVPAVQEVTLHNVTGGTFTLRYSTGQKSSDPWLM